MRHSMFGLENLAGCFWRFESRVASCLGVFTRRDGVPSK